MAAGGISISEDGNIKDSNSWQPIDQPGGAFDFTRTVPESCLEYMLVVVDESLGQRQTFSELDRLRRDALKLASALTKDYIWHRDDFNLAVRTENGLSYLYGRTEYGDSVEDEWLIVYILRELTKDAPRLWVRVADSDGEFLLIEAASVLPSWLSPEMDKHRVWIHDEQLRIIPIQADGSKELSLPQAVAILEENPASLIYSTFIEAESFYRLERYPKQIEESMHYALARLPRKLAYILHEQPGAIALATEAFYLQDPASLKSLIGADETKLKFAPNDMVTVSVKFTRVLYAQTKSQMFTPLPSWKPLLLQAATSNAGDSGASTSSAEMQLSLGMKIAAGFELLARSSAKGNDKRLASVKMLIDDVEEPYDMGLDLPTDTEIAGWKHAEREDDDSWMNIDFEDLKKELDGRNGKRKATQGDKETGFGSKETQADLRKIVSRFEAFLNDRRAGIDGAEFDDMDHDDDDDEDDGEEDDSEGEDDEVSFDEEAFTNMMQEMMGFPVPSQVNSPLGPNVEKQSLRRIVEEPGDSMTEDDEDEDIRQLSLQMEAELNGQGALTLDPTLRQLRAMRGKAKSLSRSRAVSGVTEKASADPSMASNQKHADRTDAEGEQDDQDDESEEVDIDYNLAKNLLESLKSQGGTAGPVGNILGDMGIRLPRDDGDEGATKHQSSKS